MHGHLRGYDINTLIVPVKVFLIQFIFRDASTCRGISGRCRRRHTPITARRRGMEINARFIAWRAKCVAMENAWR